jgi:hypothetical protein
MSNRFIAELWGDGTPTAFSPSAWIARSENFVFIAIYGAIWQKLEDNDYVWSNGA